MKTTYTIICLCVLSLLVNTSCKEKRKSRKKSKPTPEATSQLSKKEILELDSQLSEIVKDIEYQKEIKYPNKFYYFSGNSTFKKLATALAKSANSDYANSPSKFLRDEYSRVKSQISTNPGSLISASVSRTSISNDTKGSGYKFNVSSSATTFIPLSFRVTGDIIPYYEDVSKPWNGGDYDKRGYGDPIKKGLVFDNRFSTNSNSGYFIIWNRARGEKYSAKEFTEACDRLHHGQHAGRMFARTWKRYSRGWKLRNIKPTSIRIQ
ncbi:MAG: hypothetical protein KJO79_11120 [Verrucomicrobiae bacterium]|nr:hypothetical protein [Verrucomicrobiae bacterium]NNJ87725.1 hypothetical protein [Akkermansiaceae bacterium]